METTRDDLNVYFAHVVEMITPMVSSKSKGSTSIMADKHGECEEEEVGSDVSGSFCCAKCTGLATGVEDALSKVYGYLLVPGKTLQVFDF